MSDSEKYKIKAEKDPKLAVKLSIELFGKKFTGAAEKNGEYLNISAYSESELNIKDFISAAADKLGLELVVPDAFDLSIERLGVDYIKNVLSFECEFDKFLRKISFGYENKNKDYFLGFTVQDLNLTEIPFISEFAGGAKFGLNDLSLIFGTTAQSYKYSPAKSAESKSFDVNAGLSLCGNICGFDFAQLLKPYEKKVRDDAENETALSENTSGPTTFWADINKKVSVITLHRAGFSYDNGELGVMLDISASINPFTVSLLGAGLRVNMDTKDVKFLLLGLGLEFDNGFLTIGGAFNKSGDKYSGALTVGIKTIKITLIGTYKKGKFLAYALINANIGGPPAFFVTGLAAAFGYNKRIVLPDIGSVPDFPLVAAAVKNKMSLAEMINKLENGKYISDYEGDRFISAGIKFTSFNMIESFVLLNVGFGSKLSFSLLGTSEISIPPMTKKNPIAYAQLALKAVIDPSEGVVSVQAQLTPESYILDKECKLTGGFAFFLWFGSNPHSGDFVLSLGGYHPKYDKPSHYPDVPRIGINWQITDQLSVSGEAYFALTPSCIMAGARISALYKDGNLKAWFIAQADFLIGWKPFEYSAHLCVSLGASYTVDCWFIHHTFTIELGVELDFHGPDFSGKARISWFIISFTIKFGSDKQNTPPISYQEFEQSFLPCQKEKSTSALFSDNKPKPLTVTVNGKILGEKNGVKYVSSDGLSFIVSSAVPVSDGTLVIRPMKSTVFADGKPFRSEITFDKEGIENYTVTEYVRRAPAALWGGNGELREVTSGYVITVNDPYFEAFPKNRFISLEELYDKNIQIYEGYKFRQSVKTEYKARDTIKEFMETANNVGEARTAFIKAMGVIPISDITLAVYAENAETLFDENILIKE